MKEEKKHETGKNNGFKNASSSKRWKLCKVYFNLKQIGFYK